MIVAKRPALIAVAAILASTLFLYQSALFVESNRFNQLHTIGKARTSLYAKSLRDSLEKYRPIPYLLSRDIRIRKLLKKELPPIKVNPHLEDFGHTGKLLIYVLDRSGNTVASSNWRSKQSLVGYNLAFRPYFTDAREGTPGGYYAIGIKTGRPGFFISYPVLENGGFLGVVVVKVHLEQLQEAWQKSGETIIVSDAFGVLFLSSRPGWRYRSLRPLSDKTTKWLQNEQYPGQTFSPLNIKRKAQGRGNILHIGTTSFLEQSEQLLEYGWRIHYLSNLDPVITSFRMALFGGAGMLISILLTSLYIRERRQRHRTKQEAKEAKAIKELNELLTIEIAEHKETEKNLEKTQNELIQAGKLAALGRMSAAVAHELNQPVTAIRTFLASSRILIERNQVGEVGKNLTMIDSLTERMMAVTGQLKTFARKGETVKELVNLQSVVRNVLTFLAPQLSENMVFVRSSLNEREKLQVYGDSLQLEQVITNLIKNGFDAMEDNESDKILDIVLSKVNNEAICTIQDNGPGIVENAVDSLFEPFFTTKEIGQGLGLGLSISYGIIKEMGGTITAENAEQGGALFTLHLPLARISHDFFD